MRTNSDVSNRCLHLQLKRGEARSSVQVALQLVQHAHPIEVQHFGYTVLQHVVRGLLIINMQSRYSSADSGLQVGVHAASGWQSME